METSSQELLMKRMQETRDKIEYKKLQTVKLYFIDDKRAEEVAKIMGTSVKMVYYTTGRYKKLGLSGLVNKKRGGRQWAYMALEEEKKILDSLGEEANKGMFVIVKLIKVKVEEKLGYAVSHDYVQDLLNRHGWRKLMPRPKHPKSSKEEQEEFKKKPLN
jgi:transposase